MPLRLPSIHRLATKREVAATKIRRVVEPRSSLYISLIVKIVLRLLFYNLQSTTLSTFGVFAVSYVSRIVPIAVQTLFLRPSNESRNECRAAQPEKIDKCVSALVLPHHGRRVVANECVRTEAPLRHPG